MQIFKFITIFGLVVLVPGLRAEDPAPSESSQWNLDTSFQHYFLPEESDLSMPVLSLSWNDFLFEGRYNYEDRDTLSLWFGHTWFFGDAAFGEAWEFELTPMLGGVFHTIEGMAPGLKADVTWKQLNFYSEMEYVFDFDTRDGNFFYSWSELTFGLLEWLRIGIVGSRTRVYDTSVEIDRGPIVSFEFENLSLSCTALNIDSQAIMILGVEWSL